MGFLNNALSAYASRIGAFPRITDALRSGAQTVGNAFNRGFDRTVANPNGNAAPAQPQYGPMQPTSNITANLRGSYVPPNSGITSANVYNARRQAAAASAAPKVTSLSGTPTSQPTGSGTPSVPQVSPELAQLQAEAAATQSGRSKDASAISDAYTGKNSSVAATDTLRSTSPTTATPPLTNNSRGPSVLDALRSKVTSLATPSDTENQLNDELTTLRENERLGITGLEGQGRGIPLSLVRGQQAKLQQQGNIQEQTLLDRIAAESAKRQAALTAAQNEYTNAQAQQDKQDALTKPTSVGNAILQFDPKTGTYKTLYTAPEQATAGPASVQEYEYAKANNYTGSYTDFLQAKAQATAQGGGAYNLSPGQIRYDANGNIISQAPAASKPLSAADKRIQFLGTNAQSGLDYIANSLLKTGGGVIGSRALIASPDYKSAEDKVVSFLGYLASGANVPEQEIARLRGLLPTRLKSDAQATADLKTLQDSLNVYMSTDSGSQDTGSTGSQYSPEELQYLRQNGVDISSFTNALSTAQNGSASQIAAAIKKTESNGNYNARGGSGEFGAYQFMPATWKTWAGKYLGDPNAQMSPQNQDAVAQAHIQDLLNQGYNAQQVALLWNSGRTTPVKGVNKYGVAYDSGAYANKVLNNLNA